MTYFNGSLHGYNSPKGYIPPVPVTRVYCDACAVEAIPLDKSKPNGQEHWDTGFRWAPVYGDNKQCDCCGKKV